MTHLLYQLSLQLMLSQGLAKKRKKGKEKKRKEKKEANRWINGETENRK